MYGSESSSDGGWISWFIELEGHEFFVEVRSSWGADASNTVHAYLKCIFIRWMWNISETRSIYMG